MRLVEFTDPLLTISLTFAMNGSELPDWHKEYALKLQAVIVQIAQAAGGLTPADIGSWIVARKEEWEIPSSVAEKIIALCDHVAGPADAPRDFGYYWRDVPKPWQAMRAKLLEESGAAVPA